MNNIHAFSMQKYLLLIIGAMGMFVIGTMQGMLKRTVPFGKSTLQQALKSVTSAKQLLRKPTEQPLLPFEQSPYQEPIKYPTQLPFGQSFEVEEKFQLPPMGIGQQQAQFDLYLRPLLEQLAQDMGVEYEALVQELTEDPDQLLSYLQVRQERLELAKKSSQDVITKLTLQVKKLQEELQKASKKDTQLVSDVTKAQRQLEQLNEQLQTLQNQVTNERRAKEQAEKKVQELQEQITQLTQKLEVAPPQDVESIRQELEQEKEQVHALEVQIKELTQSLENAGVEKKALEDEKAVLHNNITEQQKDIDARGELIVQSADIVQNIVDALTWYEQEYQALLEVLSAVWYSLQDVEYAQQEAP